MAAAYIAELAGGAGKSLQFIIEKLFTLNSNCKMLP